MAKGKYFWLKLRDDFFQNDEIEYLEEEYGGEILLFYIKLCTKAIRNNGYIVREVGNKTMPYSPSKLQEYAKLDCVNKVVEYISTLEYLGLVEKLEDGTMYLPKVPEMLGMTSTNAERQKRYRERKKAALLKDSEEETAETTQETTESVTETVTEAVTESVTDVTEEKPKKQKFKVPTLQEVSDYIESKGYKVDAKFFYEYYSAMDWCDKSGARVKNWKGRVVTWNKREEVKNNECAGSPGNSRGRGNAGNLGTDKQKKTDGVDWTSNSNGW